MKRRITIALILTILLSMVLLPMAFAADSAQFSIVEMHQDGEAITMFLTRYNGEWNPDNRTYTKDQYVVKMGDSQANVTDVTGLTENDKIHYILLVDISGSISKKASKGSVSEADAINQSLQRFYDELKPNEYVTLIPFGSSGQNILIREKNKSQIGEWPTLEFKDSYTHMFEAIVTGAQVYEANAGSYARTAMVMITDGTDDYTNGSASRQNEDHYTFEQAKEIISNANVPFYALLFKRAENKTGNQDQVQEMAGISYGSTVTVDTAHLNEKLNSLRTITRNSSLVRISLIQDPKNRKEGIQNTPFVVNLSNVGTTRERAFNVDWNKITTEIDAYLEKLQVVGEINEDDEEIRVNTEAGATVSFTRGNTVKTVTARPNGEAIWAFAREDIQLRPGEKIEIYAEDANGNSELDSDDRSMNKPQNPITVTVEESKLEKIEVTVPNDVLEKGLFGETLQFMIHGEPGEEVEIAWSAESDLRPISKSLQEKLQNNGDLNVSLQFVSVNGSDVDRITGGNLVVNYKSGKGRSKVGRSKGSIEWNRNAPTEQRQIAVTAQEITEDDDAMIVNTEPGAEVVIRKGGKEVYRGVADESGDVTWTFGENDYPSAGDNYTVTARHELGSNVPTAKVVIGESKRAQIEVEINQDPAYTIPEDSQREGVIFGDTMVLTVRGEKNQPIEISWEADEIESKTFDDQFKQNGVLERTMSFEELNGSDWGIVQNGNIRVRYTDGKGRSKEGDSQTVTWTRQVPEVADTTVEEVREYGSALTEDSVSWTLKTEPDAIVTVNWGNDKNAVDVPVDTKGLVALDVPTGLEEGTQVIVTAKDSNGNIGEPTAFTVGKTKRADIQVDAMGDVIQDKEIRVSGRAEKNTDIEILWTPKDGSATVSHVEISGAEGIFSTVFTGDECVIGPGYLTVQYADGHGSSKTNAVNGVVNWYSPSPSPSPTPTIEPTATPTPVPLEPTATPEPTVAPSIIDKAKTWVNDNLGSGPEMLRNPKFWLLIVAVLLIIALIVWLVLALVHRSKEKKLSIGSVEGADAPREGDNPNSGLETTRAGGLSDIHPDPKKTQNTTPADTTKGMGTIVNDTSRTVPKVQDPAKAGSGTIRLGMNAIPTPAADGTKTVRIDRGPKPLELRLEESHETRGRVGERKVAILKELTVGRSDAVNIKINDETVSGKHLKIEREENMLFVTDNNSSNGTLLNGARLTERRPLKDGDTLMIGRTTLVVHYNI